MIWPKEPRKQALLAGLLMGLLAWPALCFGQGLQACPGINVAISGKGFQQITATSSAQKLTVPFGTLYAMINVEGAASTNIRYREDGTAPTTSTGTLVPALVTTASNVPPVYIVVCQNELALFQFIAVAGSPVLNVHYYGR